MMAGNFCQYGIDDPCMLRMISVVTPANSRKSQLASEF